MLKLIAAKDALAGGAAAGDDAVGELEDNLYEANARLEEEQERAAGLEAEKGALAQQLQEARTSLYLPVSPAAAGGAPGGRAQPRLAMSPCISLRTASLCLPVSPYISLAPPCISKRARRRRTAAPR